MSLIFLIPTAKEMQEQLPTTVENSIPANPDIINTLSDLSTDELAKKYKVSQTIAQKEAQNIIELKEKTAHCYPALNLFNGLMYRNIKRDNLNTGEKDFIEKYVYITSSLYGIIPAFSTISPHRLDFNIPIKIDKLSLKNFWRPLYDQFITDENTYISLLSSEFESVFSPKNQKTLIRLKFLEEKNGALKSHSTISKKARGQFLSQAIAQKCQTIDSLKTLTFHNFHYSTDLSTSHEFIFVKSEEK